MLSLLKKKKKEKLPARQRGNACLNCNVTLDGNENYCPDCGQRNNINQLNFKLVVDEFVGNLITYDSRVWKTAVPLILKPGRVAFEFIGGKRKYFVNPFRTYFTVSLLFFLIYGLLGKISEFSGDAAAMQPELIKNSSNIDSLSNEQKDSIVQAALANVQKNVPIKIDSAITKNNILIDGNSISMDSVTNATIENNPFSKKIKDFYTYYGNNKDHTPYQAIDSLGYEFSFWNRFYYNKTQKTHDMIKGKSDEFFKIVFSNLSIAIFIFLPVFALLLKFIYLRRKYTYMEHLVFVFYTQSVFFLLLLLFLFLNVGFKDNSGSLFSIAVLLFSIYLLIAMKNFYQQGWIKTFIKYMIANFSFMMFASFGAVLLAAISFIFY